MSTPAPLVGLSKAEALSVQDSASLADLEWQERYDRGRHGECWADSHDYTWSRGVGEVCVTRGPFDCPLGLCPVHCKEVHVCKA